MPDDPQVLIARLKRAHQRAADAPAYSPDWDAAMALIEDLERRIAELREAQRDDAPLATPIPI
jgi:hypothetical protein